MPSGVHGLGLEPTEQFQEVACHHAMLSQEEKRQIQAKLPPRTRPLVLETFVWPKELLRKVAEALAAPE